MTSIRLEGGRLIVDPEGPLSLPETLVPEFLEAMFEEQDPDLDTHIAAIHKRLSQQDKERFELACDQAGEPYSVMWANAALIWAAVGSLTATWDISGMKVCFREHVGSWLIEHAVLTSPGIWYVTTPKGVMTLPEFEHMWGITVEHHLKTYVEARQFVCERLIRTINGDMIWREVQLELPNGSLSIEKRHGPAEIDVREWAFGPNEKFLTTTDEYQP